MQTFHLWHWECKLYWQCLMGRVEENMLAPVAFYYLMQSALFVLKSW